MIGGGDGGVIREVAKHPSVETIVQCEIDEVSMYIQEWVTTMFITTTHWHQFKLHSQIWHFSAVSQTESKSKIFVL